MNNLQMLANAGAQIVIPADTLVAMIREEREMAYTNGVLIGKEIERRSQELTAPLSKEEAAAALGCSRGTIDNLRRRGELESWKLGDDVKIDRAEIERFKRLHRDIH